eukprot:TRINITY_DN70919_c0_g1_i1.p1 TRINITY_DN70919_c0_g1~~TRINITY_DN70919_c0_g1_i1.p1  ORF type:complete len:392 (+),score=8.98 TRINITY_DN70919_c0_g1_i1:20-1195(+)
MPNPFIWSVRFVCWDIGGGNFRYKTMAGNCWFTTGALFTMMLLIFPLTLPTTFSNWSAGGDVVLSFKVQTPMRNISARPPAGWGGDYWHWYVHFPSEKLRNPQSLCQKALPWMADALGPHCRIIKGSCRMLCTYQPLIQLAVQHCDKRGEEPNAIHYLPKHVHSATLFIWIALSAFVGFSLLNCVRTLVFPRPWDQLVLFIMIVWSSLTLLCVIGAYTYLNNWANNPTACGDTELFDVAEQVTIATVMQSFLLTDSPTMTDVTSYNTTYGMVYPPTKIYPLPTPWVKTNWNMGAEHKSGPVAFWVIFFIIMTWGIISFYIRGFVYSLDHETFFTHCCPFMPAVRREKEELLRKNYVARSGYKTGYGTEKNNRPVSLPNVSFHQTEAPQPLV